MARPSGRAWPERREPRRAGELQREAAWRASERRNLLQPRRSEGRHRELAPALQPRIRTPIWLC